jgi:hypothetical protein
MKPRTALLSIVIAGMTVSVPISAAFSAERQQRLDDGSRFSDRDHLKTWKSQEDTLERALKIGESKDFYRRELTKMGWQITSVNYDKPDYPSTRSSRATTRSKCKLTSTRTATRRPKST